MNRKDLIIDLARLVISAAWVDGDLCNEEVNALKDLLFSLEEISAEDWTVLTMYMESQAAEGEKDEILERVVQSLRTEADKSFALDTLEALFKSDGKVTSEEQQLMDELRNIIGGQSTNIFSSLSKAFKSAIRQRSSKVKSTLLREENSEDYIKNTIYYDLKRKQEGSGVSMNKPDSDIRKLCFATGLLARIANADNEISADEKDAMIRILAKDWSLSANDAEMLVDISCDRTTKGLDYFRLSYGFFECTSIPERQSFLKTLFKVANAANKTDCNEIEEIRRIAQSLKLSHKDFIDAKLTISRDDRNGL